MEPLSGKETASRVTGIISPKHQVHGYSVDLTVKNVFAVDPTGRVDFGGGEYTPAGRIAVSPLRRNPEDKYLWWDLGKASYFVEYNETLDLAPDELGMIEPDERLLRAGASHVPISVRGRVSPVETLLNVEIMGVMLKQNARISRVRVYKLPGAHAMLVTPITKAAAAPKKAKKRK
jgi:deoxycytidine triphosphate deaminase